MASNQNFVDYVSEQANLAGRLTFKKMFGEYAVYVDLKVVGFICDNQLLVKPTAAGKQWVGNIAEAPPCPGAKLHYLLSERLEDRDFVRQLLLITASELPAPKPKLKTKTKTKVKTKLKTKIKTKRPPT